MKEIAYRFAKLIVFFKKIITQIYIYVFFT